jgi:hypothetical protein
MTTRQWLREELRDDREAIVEKSPTDWLVAIVDMAVGPMIAFRAVIASFVWGFAHGSSAKIGLSMSDPAMIAPEWNNADARDVMIVAVTLPVFFVNTALCCRPLGPAVSAYLWLQAVALAVEGVVVLSGVRL